KCDELFFLEKLDNLVSNTTALAEKTLNNATKIADLQAKASKDASNATKFQGPQSNTTLVSLCLIVDAHKKEKPQCEEIKGFQKFLAFADNSTAISHKTKNTATKIDEVKAKSSKATTRLAKLQSNATPVSDCAA
ncbi:uncharacterized protein K444DRAFT_557886, partial [Hyaloscypha bicolor E]